MPLQCEFFALEGLSQLLQTIERVRARFNPDLQILGVALTMYDRRNRLSEQVAQDVRACLGKLVFETIIPRNVRLSEAPSHGMPALIYDHRCSGSEAYIGARARADGAAAAADAGGGMSVDPTAGADRRGLGRGLSALLGEVERDRRSASRSGPGHPHAVDRRHPAASRSAAPPFRRGQRSTSSPQSIAERGVLQPIVVRRHGTGYQIVAGERRWRASQRARLHEMPAIVREFTDTETLEIAIVENIQRADLNAIEEAEAYQRLIEDFGHSQEELGKLVNKSRSHVANLLRLLDLPEVGARRRSRNGELSAWAMPAR